MNLPFPRQLQYLFMKKVNLTNQLYGRQYCRTNSMASYRLVSELLQQNYIYPILLLSLRSGQRQHSLNTISLYTIAIAIAQAAFKSQVNDELSQNSVNDSFSFPISLKFTTDNRYSIRGRLAQNESRTTNLQIQIYRGELNVGESYVVEPRVIVKHDNEYMKSTSVSDQLSLRCQVNFKHIPFKHIPSLRAELQYKSRILVSNFIYVTCIGANQDIIQPYGHRLARPNLTSYFKKFCLTPMGLWLMKWPKSKSGHLVEFQLKQSQNRAAVSFVSSLPQ